MNRKKFEIFKHANSEFQARNFSLAASLYSKGIADCPDISWAYEFNRDLALKRAATDGRENTVERPLYVTLTSISSRLPMLTTVIESLLNQTVLPDKVNVYLSEEPFLLDKGVEPGSEHVKAICDYPNVAVHWVDNTGPYRKIAPFLEWHFSYSPWQEKCFVTVDDDTVYPPYFLEMLLGEMDKEQCVIAFRGRKATVRFGKVQPYSEWQLGQNCVSYLNVPTGKDGVVYSTRFFTEEFLRLDIAQELAPTADDLWIKWHLISNGVPAKILRPEAATSDYESFPVVDYSASYRDVSLYRALNSTESGRKNDRSIVELESFVDGKFGFCLADMAECDV